MDLKGAALKVAVPAWLILVVGTAAVVLTGNAEPYLSPADLPVGQDAAVFGSLGIAFVGAVILGILQSRHKRGKWETGGKTAGLESTSGGRFPDLSGVVRGRTVTASVETRTVSTEEGNTTTEYKTHVETAVDGSSGEGAILGGDRSEIDADRGTVDFEALAESTGDLEGLTLITAGDLLVVATSTEVGRALAGDGVQDALRSLNGVNLVYVGDAGRVVEQHAEAQNSELAGSIFGYAIDTLLGAVPGDGGTVSIESKRLVLDGAELRRQAEAVGVVADAFEETV